MAKGRTKDRAVTPDASLAASATALPSSIVDIPMQDKSDWCWAAILEAVSIRDGTPSSQSELAARVFRDRPAGGRGDDMCGMAFAVSKLTDIEPPDLHPLMFEEVRDLLQQNKIIACCVRSASGMAHWIAFTGYGAGGTVLVGDPWETAPRKSLMPFNIACNHYDVGLFTESPGSISEMYAL